MAHWFLYLSFYWQGWVWEIGVRQIPTWRRQCALIVVHQEGLMSFPQKLIINSFKYGVECWFWHFHLGLDIFLDRSNVPLISFSCDNYPSIVLFKKSLFIFFHEWGRQKKKVHTQHQPGFGAMIQPQLQPALDHGHVWHIQGGLQTWTCRSALWNIAF